MSDHEDADAHVCSAPGSPNTHIDKHRFASLTAWLGAATWRHRQGAAALTPSRMASIPAGHRLFEVASVSSVFAGALVPCKCAVNVRGSRTQTLRTHHDPPDIVLALSPFTSLADPCTSSGDFARTRKPL
jgi:hypothetical protein